MPRQYTCVSRDEFEGFLSEFAVWDEVDLAGVNERVYEIPLPSDHHDLFVFSTIEKEAARGHGEDAIRTVVWDHRLERPVSGRKKTLRIGPTQSNPDGWKGNLQPKIFNLAQTWRHYAHDCPDCDAPMVYHEDWDFFGCSTYPQCEGTRDGGDLN